MSDFTKIENLIKIGLFAKRPKILEDLATFGIEDLLLPNPSIFSSAGELKLIAKTNAKFTLDNQDKFEEELSALLGQDIRISFFTLDGVMKAAAEPVGMTIIYQGWLQSAISISKLKQDVSLEEQWRLQTSRSIALDTHPASDTPLAASAQAGPIAAVSTPAGQSKQISISSFRFPTA